MRGFWQKQIELLKAEARPDSGLEYDIVSRYALLGETENALVLLEKNQNARGGMWYAITVDPSFDSLRGNASFQAAVSRITAPK